jgi:redox-sensitive bicupin YhaK (pirin superfamily)
MSNVETDPAESVAGGTAAAKPVWELLEGHEVALGGPRGFAVTRTLPNRSRRMVGAWCFADSYGPHDLAAPGAGGMRVAAHPHTGLQTVSWLLDGEVLHRDSLGSEQLIRPGQLNLMTAGRGISHAEQTPREHSPRLHGVQLWVALPGADREVEPHFEHHAELPAHTDGGVRVTVMLGELGGAVSQARTYTPLFGADAALEPGASARLPLRPDFEYAALSLLGTVDVDGVSLGVGPLLYLGSGRSELPLAATESSRLLLLGGEPFAERLVMWWNFVGRSHEEIVRARQDWMDGDRFGTVRGYQGDPLPAPGLPNARLKARGRER